MIKLTKTASQAGRIGLACPVPKTGRTSLLRSSSSAQLKTPTRSSIVARAWLKFLEPKQQGTAAGTTATPRTGSKPGIEAKEVVIKFYEAYNAHNLDGIAALLDDDIEYHDMIYEEPFRGKDEVMAFMTKVCKLLPEDLKFVVDDITSGDRNKVGLMWHVEIGEGTVFPFSRGCSFYTVNDQGKITQARDLVEGSLKPGGAALEGLAAIAPLIRKLGPDADPSNLKRLPLAAAAVWAFYAAYTGYIMLGTSAPGLPAWQTPPEVLQEVLHESLNFFYVNIGLNAVGIDLVPDIPEHPVSEAFFNFVGAWGLMFLPVMLTERASAKVGNKVAWWTGLMFLTNVFFIPFLALRAAPEPTPASSSPAGSKASTWQQPPYPSWTAATGATALAVGLFSIYWAVEGRAGPDVGGLTERYDFFVHSISTSRVWYAFAVDSVLYSVWQAVLLSTVPTATPFHRFVPFFGLAAHLIQAPHEQEQQQ